MQVMSTLVQSTQCAPARPHQAGQLPLQEPQWPPQGLPGCPPGRPSSREPGLTREKEKVGCLGDPLVLLDPHQHLLSEFCHLSPNDYHCPSKAVEGQGVDLQFQLNKISLPLYLFHHSICKCSFTRAQWDLMNNIVEATNMNNIPTHISGENLCIWSFICKH